MTNIKVVKISALRNSEFIQYFTQILSVMQRRDPQQLGVSDECNRLKTLMAQAEGLLAGRRGHVLSERLMQLDTRRERALQSIRRMVEGYRLSHVESERNAAQKLFLHMNAFGTNIARDNYQGQTTLVRKLVADLNGNSELSLSVATLGLLSRVNELATANQLFDDDYITRAEDQGNYTAESILSMRTEITAAWVELREMLYGQNRVNRGADPWGATVKAINGLSDNYISLIARRQRGSSGLPEDQPLEDEGLTNA